jgi:hypothetical protein
MAKTISIQKVEARSYTFAMLSAPIASLAPMPRGPVEYARIRKQYIAAGEARLRCWNGRSCCLAGSAEAEQVQAMKRRGSLPGVLLLPPG